MSVDFNGAVVLVTGANGGLGQEWIRQSLERGATKIYATDLQQREWNDERIVSLVLDITDNASVTSAAQTALDTTIVINNAGVAFREPLLTTDEETMRRVFDINFFGPVAVSKAFAPVLKNNGGGAILNVTSVLSWLVVPPVYSSAKAALWMATNALRLELLPQGTAVVSLHMGYTDTPMTKALNVRKNDPVDVVRAGLDGIANGAYEVLADKLSVQVKRALSEPVEVLYPQLTGSALRFDQQPHILAEQASA
ncbi:SDR family oxidoreductase [Rhizobiaceae bacterium CRRU44]|uniref:SDR family oxidoreductase n=1 Tax=Ferranicluibacter rubi TaxID=2715133 RepID=A0AA43ZGZ5_9HYPH|nr:SDR family oxidoreductase [Ferranicluibacter rubi]NHT76860.1 SDR family oxidoreductase [Ferranicluibacter rubi]